MLKKIIMPMLTFVFLTAALSASQKIVTFESSLTDKEEKILEIKKLGGNPLKDLWLINAITATFPDDIKDSKIYSLKGVIRVEDDKYQNWLLNEENLSVKNLPTVGEMIETVKEESTIETPQAQNAVKTKSDKEVPWGVERVNAPAAWDFNQANGVKVAVVDTGVDYTHPDLAENYVDGYNATDPSSPQIDDHGHGTHVAGTIGAIKNGEGVVGVGPKVKIYGVKVLSASGSGSYSDVMDGIQWAVKNKMQVINMSLGGRSTIESFHEVIKKAKEAGVTIVCAAGNDSGAVNYPAKYPETIAVSAGTSSNGIAYFSSRGPEIDFIAPGVSIYSTYKGGKYKKMSGTSMACPHVAGLAAMAAAAGNDTPDKVKESLKKAARDLGLAPEKQGFGLIDAAKIK